MRWIHNILLGVSAVMFSLLVSCTDLINLSHGLDDPYEGMKPTLVRAGEGQESEINTVDLSLSLQSPQMGVLWGIDWVSEWQYSWNESEPGYGVLGYSAPGLMKSTIYSVDRNTKKRYTPFYKIFDPDGGRVSLSTGYVYDILLYSYGTEYTLFSQSDDNETYTASTHINDYFTSQSEGSETDSYVDYYMPNELLGSMISSMDLSGKPSGYDKEIALDGTVTYVKPMSVTLKPFSFIYLMQIVVLKNADYSGNRIIGVKDVTVTGLAQGVDLFTGKTMDNTISITTDDIKPLQNHNNVRLDDETTVDNADILAARMLTWGLPGIVPLESTKAGTKVPVLDNNYIDITLMLRNGKTQSVSIDITEQMHNKPTGGVITVVVDANNLHGENNASSVSSPDGYENGYAYVDLGLNVKWATFNVGASVPEEYGDYYAWGETELKTEYSWNTYKWCKGTNNTLVKYCNNSEYGYNGYVDNIGNLEPEDDVAYVKWGGSWRIPTISDFQELRNNCSWVEQEYNGVMGYIVTSNKKGYTDKSIFIPSAGHFEGNNVYYVGSSVCYWSRTLCSSSYPCGAFRLTPSPGGVMSGFVRYLGYSIRAVCP